MKLTESKLLLKNVQIKILVFRTALIHPTRETDLPVVQTGTSKLFRLFSEYCLKIKSVAQDRAEGTTI